MPYTPKTWTTGETITAAELNAIEQAAAAAAVKTDADAAYDAKGAAAAAQAAAVAAAAADATGKANAAQAAAIAASAGQVTDAAVATQVTSGATTVAALKSAFVPYLIADSTGATNAGPALQAAFDAAPTVHLKPGGTYLVSTPVFLDSSDARIRYTLEMNGATLIIGSGLPSASTFSTGTTTKWAFFNGNLRAALSAGVVNCSAANRSTGGAYPSAPRLLVRNGVIDGQAADVGFVYGNTSATRFERLVGYQLKYGMSWTGYTDGNSVSNCQLVSQPTGGWLVRQEAVGDGTLISGIKGGNSGIWFAQSCYGGRVEGGIGGGYSFTSCRSITIDACHQELDETTGAFDYFVRVDRSQVTINSSFSDSGKAASKYVLLIADGNPGIAPHNASDVTLNNFVSTFYLRGETDPGRDPSIYVSSAWANTRLRVRDSYSYVWSSGDAGAPSSKEGIFAASLDSGVTSALAAGAAQIATGNFDLQQIDGAWRVTTPLQAAIDPRPVAPPTLTVAATSNATGSLTNGQVYEYTAAIKNANGAYTPITAAVSATATAAGTVQINLTNPSGPAVITLWRKTGTGVTATPDRYIEIPLNGVATFWYDTGTRINGRAWTTTGIPVPTAVAAPAGWSKLKRGQIAVGEATIPRLDAQGGTSTLVSGAPRFTYLIAEKTETVSQVRVVTGNSAAAGLTLARIGIYSVDGLGNLALIASTANDATLFGAASTAYTRALTVPFAKVEGQLYAVAVMVVGTTGPAIMAAAMSPGAAQYTAVYPPVVTGIAGQADLPASVAAGSLTAQTAPLYTELLP